MHKIVAGLVLGFAVTSAPSSAAEGRAKNDPDELVCKREKKTNSRFTTKTCYTRAQWAAMAEQNKRDFGETRDRPNIDIRRTP